MPARTAALALLLLVGNGVVGRAASPADWWSLRPLARPTIPKDSTHPVDAFILAALSQKGLIPSPEADRRTLLRRLSIDLTGLPPTPDELRDFLADNRPDAYERQVDRLLASPRYGERWARHWLDVARYADTHGHDQDRPRPNAWPYRDYVIRAFNADKPYARFVREQIAGDVLYPDDPAALEATGFLAAGPWDESSLRDINENSADRIVGQYLDRDEMVSAVMGAFVGVTAQCARCHDHKFDPVSQEDYYALQAVFAGIDKAERPYDADPAVARRRADLRKQLAEVKSLRGKADATLLTPERQAEAAAFAATFGDSNRRWTVPEAEARSANGQSLSKQDDGSFLAGGQRPEKDTTTLTLTTPMSRITGLRLEVLCDGSLPHHGPGRQDNGNLHLSEIRVTVKPRGAAGKPAPVRLKSATADFDQDGWGVSRAIDGNAATAWGIYPAVGKPHSAVFEFAEPVAHTDGAVLTVELDQHHGGGHLIGRPRLSLTSADAPGVAEKPLPADLAAIIRTPAGERTAVQKAELVRIALERRLEGELAALPTPAKVYCGTPEFAPEGSFRPAKTPRPVSVLKRGDASKPIKAAVPGAIGCVEGLSARFDVSADAGEGGRRAALAGWLADEKNVLTWRVIVNRVWHWHFGRGIADTPHDLGRMGGSPSHPELLDWLAVEFRDGGGSLKKLHRLIVTSATYRQAVRHDPKAARIDAENRLLWRANRRKLDAETLRDAILHASGRLDETMYGPPAAHFALKPAIHVTPSPDYDAADLDAPAARRRAVYRFVFRTRPDPFLEALDCPDASQPAPTRAASVGPLQALALWNDRFMTRQSEHLASLAEKSAGSLAGRVNFVAERLWCRPPDADETRLLTAHAEKHGLASVCRVMYNSSEFAFAD